jgi:DNA-binding MarR family transcriptional regulator
MPDQPIQRTAWYALVRAHSALTEITERRLEDETGMSLSWYDVLVNLYLAPGHAMRMSELAQHVLLSRSWLTRRVDQLVKAGLVERGTCPTGDGRGVMARLTRDGRKAFLRMERIHTRVLDEYFGAHLTDAEATTLRKVLERVDTVARPVALGNLVTSARK